MRQPYEVPGLTEEAAAGDPFVQFDRWFADAAEAGIKEPNAMTLATVDAGGLPDARVVLLKGVGPEDGFRFYTNKRSRKADELAARAEAALVFYWDALDRSVRVRGRVVELDDAANDAYFAQRPRGSQLGAWVSPQSSIIPDRGHLAAEQARREAEFSGRDVPRPPHWGGYAVMPRAIEFWQGQPSRLHDRLRYERSDGGWSRVRLAP
ncbi:pyridoxamine 5'-phosphate oxidase [Phycisphaera mikurensis]|uniref:Pyridoxine/pyridoxamine 5'-phosphate oxidase n=1 Tax=Phycisphaera mikurensis (strain NBRC 102666 / KCTC 22515 / FYK2301M01) TaxID=1142394 RepID=I0IAQ2_PHYMF|nr:pyridoxine/pyridoxamine 5'-phosphate oxidase [Phycisphaera mikurensis NBRC 102666]